MRRRKSDLHARVNRNLPLEFDDVRLTSYAGLELLERYLRTRRFNQLVREAFADLPRGGDFGVVVMVRVFVGLVIVGGRRLRHLASVADDPEVDPECSASTTLAASRQLFWPVPITWIDINNIDACGWCGKRAASAGHAGTTARARFPRRWHDPQAARIPDGWGVQEVGRRRTRGNSGPGARPRGAGDGGDVRRDLSVR